MSKPMNYYPPLQTKERDFVAKFLTYLQNGKLNPLFTRCDFQMADILPSGNLNIVYVPKGEQKNLSKSCKKTFMQLVGNNEPVFWQNVWEFFQQCQENLLLKQNELAIMQKKFELWNCETIFRESVAFTNGTVLLNQGHTLQQMYDLDMRIYHLQREIKQIFEQIIQIQFFMNRHMRITNISNAGNNTWKIELE